jgi:OmpA-OmpF porin, OOP family
MNFKSILILPLLFSGFIFSQEDENLVSNPSFESMDGKLKKLKQINVAKYWNSPTALKADLFSKKKDAPVSAPVNIYGKEHPKDGDNYAGILLYSYNNKSPRTYVQTQLINPLTSGLDYCVKFHISLSDLSKYAVNNIGLHFGVEPLSLEGKGDIIFNKSDEFSRVIRDGANKVYNARYNWETVCGIYRADGKEQFITIGNFFNNKDTKYEKLKKLENFPGTQIPSAYYYVDNIEVFLIENISDCNCSANNKIKRESIVYHRDYPTDGSDVSIEIQLKRATVYFDVENDKIDDMFLKSINSIANLMKTDKGLKLELHGHTDKAEHDAIKEDPENEKLIKLSEYRAKAIFNALTAKGVESDRLIVKGFNAEQPAFPGYTMLSLAKNRRVEFKLLK